MPDTTPPFTGPDRPADAAVDAELRRAAHALMAEAPLVDAPPAPAFPIDPADPAYPAEVPAAPLRRPARVPGRGRGRLVVAAVAAAAVVVAAVAGVVTAPDEESGLSTGGWVEPAPQRLFVETQRLFASDLAAAGELGDDDVVRPLEAAGLDSVQDVRPLPGGGYVAVGETFPDGPSSPGVTVVYPTTYLVVVDAGGRVTTRREVEDGGFLGATATEALLQRQPAENDLHSGPARLFAHDLVTGAERLVSEEPAFDPELLVKERGDVVGELLVMAVGTERIDVDGPHRGRGTPGGCELHTVDVTTGERVVQPVALGCATPLGVRMSPDGGRLAVAYVVDLEDRARRLAVVDVATGEVTADAPLDDEAHAGLAWEDDDTVRVATSDDAGTVRSERVDVG